ncbi:MAG TPA: glycosyltransferase family 2 protein [Caulobacteraceae bacterium]|jgi:glycosyltransferase involved in cell wall biosynthesis|nr:glycosyltransferase family 2 protein [Caulobacteraceae bacterium]
MVDGAGIAHADGDEIGVSFVMPCLDEVLSLAVCIEACKEALVELAARFGLKGEIIIADNGSTDGSQALAERLGARVVAVPQKGYGAALRGGFEAARGRYLVMGDADGSYNFREAVDMVGELVGGADLCMGSRFAGGIARGAMPWKNRYIGNPLLTGALNLLFGTKVGDAHCGLRALTKAAFERLDLDGDGMEFASEMVIKAILKGEKIAQRPATLSPDLRDRPPHLRPWRDGWRHLRYLFMLSPYWLFALPGFISAGAGVGILGVACWQAITDPRTPHFFGDYWVVLASAMVGLGHLAVLLGMATHLHQVRAGYRRPATWVSKLSPFVTLETMLISGVGLAALGFIALLVVVAAWSARGFTPAPHVLPAVVGALLVTLGAQTMLGGFLMAILTGHHAGFLARSSQSPRPAAARTRQAPELAA